MRDASSLTRRGAFDMLVMLPRERSPTESNLGTNRQGNAQSSEGRQRASSKEVLFSHSTSSAKC